MLLDAPGSGEGLSAASPGVELRDGGDPSLDRGPGLLPQLLRHDHVLLPEVLHAPVCASSRKEGTARGGSTKTEDTRTVKREQRYAMAYL